MNLPIIILIHELLCTVYRFLSFFSLKADRSFRLIFSKNILNLRIQVYSTHCTYVFLWCTTLCVVKCVWVCRAVCGQGLILSSQLSTVIYTLIY